MSSNKNWIINQLIYKICKQFLTSLVSLKWNIEASGLDLILIMIHILHWNKGHIVLHEIEETNKEEEKHWSWNTNLVSFVREDFVIFHKLNIRGKENKQTKKKDRKKEL